VIVKRMGTPSFKEAKGVKDDDGDGDDEMGSHISDLADFRQFDPDFTGSSLTSTLMMGDTY